MKSLVLGSKLQVREPSAAVVKFGGGLNLVSTALTVNPGQFLECRNFELDVDGAPQWIQGYERFDGRSRPSDATYQILVVNITGSFAVGNTVTGATSAATGKVIVVSSADGEDYLVITRVTGTFVDAENLTVSAVVQGATVASELTWLTNLLDATYLNTAADDYRASITVVPGSGQIRGVFRYNSVTYAWRDNAGATAAELYKSTGSGWTLVALGRQLSFTSGGTTAIAEGDTITGATSAATAVVTRVVLESGTWAGGDAAGRLIFASQTGAFVAENIDVGASPNLATIAGNSAAITMLPGGRFKTYTYNSGGDTFTRRVYGCDGVNKGWEFDGTVFVPIVTGMSTSRYGDAPTNVIAHKNHLFFSFGPSNQHSGIGYPYAFDPTFGSDEIMVGDNVTGYSVESGSEGSSALAIFSQNSTHILYGDDETTWDLRKYRDDIGAYSNSIQSIGYTVMLDDQGMRSMAAAQEFGNFATAALSAEVRPFINTRKSTTRDSCIVRGKSQYRAFFADGSAMYATFDKGKLLGITTAYLSDEVTCMHSSEESDGSDGIYFGSDDGFVYQLDRGTSFDGDAIEYFGMFHYNNFGSPRLNKGWKTLAIEVSGEGYAGFSFGFELQFSSTNTAQPMNSTTEFLDAEDQFSSARWDYESWEAFFFDGSIVSPQPFKLSGSSENIAFIIRAESDMYTPLKFSGAVCRFNPRRYLR